MDLSAARLQPRQPSISEKAHTHSRFGEYMTYRAAMGGLLVQADSFELWLRNVEENERFEMPFDQPPRLDCQRCGACCVHGGEVTVSIGERVPHYLTRSVRRGMGFFTDDHYDTRRMARVPLTHMNADHSRCVALRGDVGQECRCNIYDVRPTVCQDYEQDSPECHQVRTEAGLVIATQAAE